MFRFMKRIFVSVIMFLGYNFIKRKLIRIHSIKNEECKVRPEIVNGNSNELIFYPYSIKTSKCSGSCNDINDPYAKLCVPDAIKI